MTIDELDGYIDRYTAEYILPRLHNPLNLFAIGAMRGAGKLSVRSMLPQLESLGIVKPGEVVDIEQMRKALDGGFAAAPELPFFGLRFTKADSDAFFAMVTKMS